MLICCQVQRRFGAAKCWENCWRLAVAVYCSDMVVVLGWGLSMVVVGIIRKRCNRSAEPRGGGSWSFKRNGTEQRRKGKDDGLFDLLRPFE